MVFVIETLDDSLARRKFSIVVIQFDFIKFWNFIAGGLLARETSRIGIRYWHFWYTQVHLSRLELNWLVGKRLCLTLSKLYLAHWNNELWRSSVCWSSPTTASSADYFIFPKIFSHVQVFLRISLAVGLLDIAWFIFGLGFEKFYCIDMARRELIHFNIDDLLLVSVVALT